MSVRGAERPPDTPRCSYKTRCGVKLVFLRRSVCEGVCGFLEHTLKNTDGEEDEEVDRNRPERCKEEGVSGKTYYTSCTK
jgi:hypothetical protein